jgi:cytoplasmic tRNA 2-thiolation protein 2
MSLIVDQFENAACVKCKEVLATIIRPRAAYCKDCFLSMLHHRFRMALGKPKVLNFDERILIAYSGGPSSLALTHMTWMAMNDDKNKRLRIHPIICHVDESDFVGNVRRHDCSCRWGTFFPSCHCLI